MSNSLMTALDKQFGEKLNLEYKWSVGCNLNDDITKLFFQLTRTPDNTTIKNKFKELLKNVCHQNDEDIKKYLTIICKIIVHTRDIISGKGEYELTYMMIGELYYFTKTNDCPEYYKMIITNLVCHIIENLVLEKNDKHPYGSWKDLKYILNYINIPRSTSCDNIMSKYFNSNNDVLNKVISLVSDQLEKDKHSDSPSLLSKWLPREKSNKFGWQTAYFAYNLNKKWIDTAYNKTNNYESYEVISAKRKCLTNFRQTISGINKKLNTVQINQCDNKWGDINFDKNVTSITMRKQTKAFLYTNKHVTEHNGEYYDRMKCCENYKNYINNALNKDSNVRVKGKRVSIIDFVKDACILNENLRINECHNIVDEKMAYEKAMLNAQWNENSKQTGYLENMIAMVDVSGSIEDEKSVPLHSAIGLGIRIAEKSKLGKRVLTFSSSPSWVKIDDNTTPDFISKVEKISKAHWGQSTNFRKALDLILITAINNNISPDDMGDMSLVILSDMQIDHGGNEDNKPMYDMMKEKYIFAGMNSVYKTPYKLPHIVFWNLRSTTGFPSLTSTENTSMMSGSSPMLLNEFSRKGMEFFKDLTPWKNLEHILNNERYNIFDSMI